MANRIVLKKSSVSSKVPLATDLEYGELALNYTDEKLYFKNASNVIKSLNVTPATLTIGTGLSGTSYNGTSAVTIAINSTVATLTNTQTLTNKTIAAASNTITGLTNSNLSGSAGITNANLANSSLTIGSTSVSLGATATTLAGLTSVTSTSFVGALTGNASTATTLQTARTIGGVSFNGSANINLPGVNTAGNQNTTGNAATATTLQTARSIALSGAATGTATNFNGSANITIPVTALNASNLNAGTIPDARLTGTYTNFTHRLNGSNTIFTLPNPGSSNTSARTVYGLAEYRSSSSAQVGAIIIIAPNTTSTVMHQFEIQGLLYNQNIVRLTVQGYRTTGVWSDLRKISFGTVDVQTRWGVTPDGKNCLILGDVGTSWSYPHFSVVRAMFSHTNANDGYSSGWTVAVVTSLTGYTQVTSNIANSNLVGSITGNAVTATTLQTARTINGVSFNGSANIVVEPYVENDNSTNANRFITFVDSSTAGHQRLNEDSNFTYNPATGTVTSVGGFAAPVALMSNNITTSYSIPAGYNAISAGPITVANGVSVTVPSGSVWTIV